jgi:hypothetical protein
MTTINSNTYDADIRYVTRGHGRYNLTLTLSNPKEELKYKAPTTDMKLIDDMRDEDINIKSEAYQNAVEYVLWKNDIDYLAIARENRHIEVSIEVQSLES